MEIFTNQNMWTITEFQRWMNNGCPSNTNITHLYMESCGLDVLPQEIGLIQTLQVLVVRDNNLTCLPPEIGLLSSLTFLNCADNLISQLPPEIGKLTNLVDFMVYGNKLVELPPEIGLLTSLKYFYCSLNALTTLPHEIGELRSLVYFDVCENKITNLPHAFKNIQSLRFLFISGNDMTLFPVEITSLYRLENINISSNKITTLPSEIGLLGSLIYLNVSSNNLTTLPPELVNCQLIENLWYDENPIEYIPPNVYRIFTAQKIDHTIYTDSQSVHASSIQKSIHQSIIALLSTNPSFNFDEMLQQIMIDDVLSNETKQCLVQYSDDTNAHSILQITFGELLVAVWNRIISNKYSSEIKKVLNSEMSDSEHKCFTGRLSRLVNCLNGFESDVVINISDSERIGSIISNIKTRLEAKNEYTPTKHCLEAQIQLLEIGYSDEIIKDWLSHIN